MGKTTGAQALAQMSDRSRIAEKLIEAHETRVTGTAVRDDSGQRGGNIRPMIARDRLQKDICKNYCQLHLTLFGNRCNVYLSV